MVDLPVDVTYDAIPQHIYNDQTQQLTTVPLTLHLLSVGSKRFFVEKFDRSISGLIASQPVSGDSLLISSVVDLCFFL